MADQDQKQQSQKEYGTSEVDARQGATNQSTKDKIAEESSLHKDQYPETLEGTSLENESNDEQGATDKTAEESSLHKDQYPQVLENPSSVSAQDKNRAGGTGTSGKSV